MRYGKICGPPWDEVFLIGGGPSLRGFDFEKLRGRTTLAINDAVLHIPWATALFSLDVNWARNRATVIQEFSGEKYLALPEDGPEIPGVVYLQRSRSPGLSTDPSRVCMGGNSGYGALNVAYLKGAKRIVLLGYDFRTIRGEKHWHAGYFWDRSSSMQYFADWARNFDDAAVQLRKAGVEVLNASLESLISAFPKIRLDQVP